RPTSSKTRWTRPPGPAASRITSPSRAGSSPPSNRSRPSGSATSPPPSPRGTSRPSRQCSGALKGAQRSRERYRQHAPEHRARRRAPGLRGALGTAVAVHFATRLRRLAGALLAVVLVGYAVGNKAFAYIGVPPLFIGEFALMAILMAALLRGKLAPVLRSGPA